jgi:CRISPR-associated protein Csb3
MAEASIPVDLFNPGQVFACLGFLEAADILLGDASGGFDWSDELDVKFRLQTATDSNPVGAVLEFLASVEPRQVRPGDDKDPLTKKSDAAKKAASDNDKDEEGVADSITLEFSDTFPAPKADRMSLPIRLGGGNRRAIELGHWADGSSRESFKLYSGNRSADQIARAMLLGTCAKPKKNQQFREIKTKGIAQLWEEQRKLLLERPYHVLTPMGGSFNFDPRGAWTAIDAGYSPNEHDHLVEASPVVEFLAAWGLESARPDEFETRKVRYVAWGLPLPPILARAALCGVIAALPLRYFHFELHLSGKNKVVTFAESEHRP